MKKHYTLGLFLLLLSTLTFRELRGDAQDCPSGQDLSLRLYPGHCTTGNCHPGVVTSRPLGVNTISLREGIEAYPTSPTSELNFKVFDAYADLQYRIYSLDGKLVSMGSLPSYPAITTVSVAALNAATYVVEVSDASMQQRSFKIVKTN